MAINRFDVYLVRLDPTVGSEIRKTRPCLVVSPNEANRYSQTLIRANIRRAPRDVRAVRFHKQSCNFDVRTAIEQHVKHGSAAKS